MCIVRTKRTDGYTASVPLRWLSQRHPSTISLFILVRRSSSPTSAPELLLLIDLTYSAVVRRIVTKSHIFKYIQTTQTHTITRGQAGRHRHSGGRRWTTAQRKTDWSSLSRLRNQPQLASERWVANICQRPTRHHHLATNYTAEKSN